MVMDKWALLQKYKVSLTFKMNQCISSCYQTNKKNPKHHTIISLHAEKV